MGMYRKKPIVVEAQQLVEGEPLPSGVMRTPNMMYVVTMQGVHVIVRFGEWIICEGDGEHFYPCADEVFRRTYEAVE